MMIVLTALSLPFMTREPISLPPIVSVELIQITDKTNIPFAPKARKIIDKVKKDAVKKKFADRKDKDIDNDGDTDSSDEYLHKKRQAISKKMDEGELPPALKKAIDKKKGKDDEEEVEEGKDKIKYRGNLKDLTAMKEDFMIIIEKYGLDQVKTIINSIEK